jgi:fructose-specific phosphotransferase system IIC component
MATFSEEHRRFLIVDEIVAPAVVNFLLNAGIAWYLVRTLATVPLWGSPGIAVDTLSTAFVLPVLTALIAAWLIRVRVVRGKLSPIPDALMRPNWWSRRSFVVRGILLGAVAVVLVGTPVVSLFALFGAERLPRTSFIWFKASFAAGVGVLVTPLLGWWALMDASRRPRS